VSVIFQAIVYITCSCVCNISGYPLAVKLGTITKDGKADVFSYDEDNMVEDPNLIVHLAHFGINITQMEKVITRHFIFLWLCC
jgi:uncharacterized UBP type Zn finger protein